MVVAVWSLCIVMFGLNIAFNNFSVLSHLLDRLLPSRLLVLRVSIIPSVTDNCSTSISSNERINSLEKCDVTEVQTLD